MQLIAFSDVPLGVTQIAAQVGTAKGAVHKHLRTLGDHGMVAQDPVTSLYSLGPKIWLMAQKAPPGRTLAELALPLMRVTRDELGLAVVLSVPTARSAYVLATLSSNQPIEIGVRPGGELSLHSSAQGKVFLAFGDPSLPESLAPPLERFTPKTQTDVGSVRAELEQIRRQGYATAPEESLLGINALAAPIFDSRGQIAGAIGLIGSVQHLGSQPSDTQLDGLLRLTAAISRRLDEGSGGVSKPSPAP
nr:IclR family transcriptional regulator [Paracoccus sp. S-4012]